MVKKNVILPYKRSVGFPNINHLYKLNYDKKNLNSIREIILDKINKQEYKNNRIPWWFWLIICFSLACVITGIIAISLSPFNYIILSFGILLFILIGFLFCFRFGKKKNFVNNGLELIERLYGDDIEIFKVYEKEKDGKTPKILKAIVLKLKKNKSRKKSDQIGDNESESESTFQENIPVKSSTVWKQKKFYNHNENQNNSDWVRSESLKPINSNQPIIENDQRDYIGSFNNQRNNLRMRESDFVEVAPEGDSFQLRDSKELLNDDEPQDFYDPFNMENMEIEPYSNEKKSEAMFVSNNPYGFQPVQDKRVEKNPESNPLDIVEIDVNNFTRK